MALLGRPKKVSCPVWAATFRATEESWGTRDTSNPEFVYFSERAGGKFIMTTFAADRIEKDNKFNTDDFKVALSTFIYENQNKVPIKIDQDILNHVSGLNQKSIVERSDELLKYYSQIIGRIGDAAPALASQSSNWGRLLAPTSSTQLSEVSYLWSFLKSRGFVDRSLPRYSDASDGYVPPTIISPEGYIYLEKINTSNEESNSVFVAMWFDDTMKTTKLAIEEAVADCGFSPRRVDDEEFNGEISDAIIALIRQSVFIVADFTAGLYNPEDPKSHQARGGTYWEAGFAAGLGIDVIYTCREDCINHIHFDTQRFNHIKWKDEADLKQKLTDRIMATIPSRKKR